MMRQYFDIVSQQYERIVDTQKGSITAVIQLIKQVITEDRLIHLFGTGHSHAISEEFFYRAGGLACVNAILEEPIMVHAGAVISTQMERLEHYARIVLSKHLCVQGDALIIFSQSGINPVPVEMALEGKKLGLTVVAFTSLTHSKAQKPRSKAGIRLYEAADIFIDTGIATGDASITLPNGSGVAPVSTILCDAVLHGIIAQACYELCCEGIDPPLYASANVDGGDERNQSLIEKYQPRIRSL